MTTFVLGIDIGTSYTAAAIGRRGPDGSVAYEPLELGTRKAAVPTVVYLGEDGGVVVGEPAERRAIEQPDRVVREFKRRIGDEMPIIVGGLAVAPEDLLAILAQWVVERAEAHEGTAPEVIAISHPASWGQHRLGLIRSALAGVGLASVELVSEPEAAGLHYLAHQKVEIGDAIAVYDLGGGTFDVALLRKHEDDAFRLIGVPTGIERLGGSDFDQRIFEHVRSLAGDAFDQVDERVPDGALALAQVRRECTDAKEALSFDAETVVPVLLPGGQARVRLVRSEFEQMIDESLQQTVRTLRSAIADAGLEPDDVSTVLLIGGSSRIPAVTQVISSELELPVAIDSDPKASISLGAAVAAADLLAPDATAVAAAVAAASDTEEVAADAPAAPVALEPHRMSMGLRATVLAGVAAALLALLIPISPLAAGDRQEGGEPDPTTGEQSDGAPLGRYVVGIAAPISAPFQTPFASVGDGGSSEPDADPAAPPRAIAEPGTGSVSPTTGSAAPAGTSPTTSQDDLSPANPAPTQPPADPTPAPTPDPVPVPDPSPSPSPDPVPDPVPDPSPEPSPEPVPDPIVEPQPDPQPEPQPVPEPAPEPTVP